MENGWSLTRFYSGVIRGALKISTLVKSGFKPVLYAYFPAIVNLHAVHPKFYHNFAFHFIEPVTLNRVAPGDVGKMNGIQPFAMLIEEGAEIHGIALYGANRFGGDEISYYMNSFIQESWQVAACAEDAQVNAEHFPWIT
jgi:hypothetical protein